MFKLKTLLFCIFSMALSFADASSLKSNLLETIYDLVPNIPITISNANNTNLRTWCEMHVNSNTSNTLVINQLQGIAVVNGTTLYPGNYTYLSVRQLQTIQIVAQPNSQTQFTNIGQYLIRAICY